MNDTPTRRAFPLVALRPEVADAIDRLELPFNQYGYDPYGISKHHLVEMFSLIHWIYNDFFTTRVFGIEHIPTRGRAMLIGNHSGGIPIDGTIVLGSTVFEMDPPRLAQGMVEKYVSKLPFMSWWATRAGQFTGLPEHAIRLLEQERLLLVFPEGARGAGKLFEERYDLVRFGTGFLRLALQTGAPIVPFAFVGGGDAFPTVANLYRAAKAIGAPYIPIPRYGIPYIRRTSCELYYGPPLTFEGDGTEGEARIRDMVEEVKEAVARLIDIGRRRRENGDLDAPYELTA